MKKLVWASIHLIQYRRGWSAVAVLPFFGDERPVQDYLSSGSRELFEYRAVARAAAFFLLLHQNLAGNDAVQGGRKNYLA